MCHPGKKESLKDPIENCCSDMSPKEKRAFMKRMMPKMMHHFRETGKPMMGVMGCVPGTEKSDKGTSSRDMCSEFLASLQQSQKIASLATPEVQGLFEDWVEQIEAEILEFLKNKDSVDTASLAKNFKISQESAYYFLTKLAQKGKIKLKATKKKN